MNPELESALQEFCRQCNVGISNRGTACVLLYTTRYARENGLPTDPNTLRSRNGGQVVRFSFRSVNRILSDYSPEWVDLGEAGRTNLANVWRAERYMALLNRLHQDGIADLAELERWWANRVMQLSEPQPIPLRFRKDQSLAAMFKEGNVKTQSSEPTDELRPEYDLAPLLKEATRGKYAERYRQGTNLVLLDPDVAGAFPTPEAVNEALRLVIQLARIPAEPEQQTHAR